MASDAALSRSCHAQAFSRTPRSQQFAATASYSDGSTKDVTDSATWTSSATNVASIGSSGLATGVSVGSAAIAASYGGASASTTLAVTVSFMVTGFSPGGGAPGTAIAIGGANFPTGSGAVTVKLCGIAVNLVSASATQLVVDAPTASGGTATTLASGSSAPTGIAVDAASVCFVGGGAVRKVPLSGGTPVMLAILTGSGNLTGVGLDSTYYYWADTASIYRLPLVGGTPAALVSNAYIGGMAFDGTNFYWTDAGALKTMPNGGGTITTLVSGGAGGAVAVTQ